MEHLPYFPITNHEYPPVIKHGRLENGPFINDFPVQELPWLVVSTPLKNISQLG